MIVPARFRCSWRLLPLAAAVLVSACKATPAPQGKDGAVTGNFQIRKLTADLPPEVRVPAVIAAARATLIERGYSIQSFDATEDSGTVSAVPPDAGWFESVEVRARQTGTGTEVRIVHEPVGNQTRSRSILDGVLAKLGR